MNLSMLHIGLYQRPETNLQTTHSVFLGLYLSGLNYERFRGTSGGQLISEVEDVKVPALTLIPPNVRIEFQCGQKRENWVIQCSLPELHYEAGNSFTVLHDHGHSFRLPFRTPLTVEKAHRLREKFKMIQENYQTGLPENIFCAETVASTLLADIILAQEKEKIVTAAEKFKNMIDRDSCFRKTLAELSREAQCSAGHIRKLFVKQYLIEPGEYRAPASAQDHALYRTDRPEPQGNRGSGRHETCDASAPVPQGTLRHDSANAVETVSRRINPLTNRIHSGHRHKSAVPRRRSSGNIRRPYKRQRL